MVLLHGEIMTKRAIMKESKFLPVHKKCFYHNSNKVVWDEINQSRACPECYEDLVLSALAEKRDHKEAKRLKHQDVWAGK